MGFQKLPLRTIQPGRAFVRFSSLTGHETASPWTANDRPSSENPVSEYLPKDIREQLRAALSKTRRARATRTVHVGDEAFAILEMGEDGFAVDFDATPRLRGLIDIYEGPRHLYQALIVAAARHGDTMHYDFKRNTAATLTPPVDFELSETRPAGLLTRA